VAKKPLENSEIFHANSEKSKRFQRNPEKSKNLFYTLMQLLHSWLFDSIMGKAKIGSFENEQP